MNHNNSQIILILYSFFFLCVFLVSNDFTHLYAQNRSHHRRLSPNLDKIFTFWIFATYHTVFRWCQGKFSKIIYFLSVKIFACFFLLCLLTVYTHWLGDIFCLYLCLAQHQGLSFFSTHFQTKWCHWIINVKKSKPYLISCVCVWLTDIKLNTFTRINLKSYVRTDRQTHTQPICMQTKTKNKIGRQPKVWIIYENEKR